MGGWLVVGVVGVVGLCGTGWGRSLMEKRGSGGWSGTDWDRRGCGALARLVWVGKGFQVPMFCLGVGRRCTVRGVVLLSLGVGGVFSPEKKKRPASMKKKPAPASRRAFFRLSSSPHSNNEPT